MNESSRHVHFRADHSRHLSGSNVSPQVLQFPNMNCNVLGRILNKEERGDIGKGFSLSFKIAVNGTMRLAVLTMLD